MEKIKLNAAALKAREMRHNPLDDLYSLEGGVTLGEQVTVAREVIADGTPEAQLLDAALIGPVAYLSMPDRYDLSDILAHTDNGQFRALRESLRKSDPEAHELLEQQRVRVNNLGGMFQYPVWFAGFKQLGDASALRALEERLDALLTRVTAKEGADELDHRTMTDAQKDDVVREASVLARDIIVFALATAAPKEV